MPKSTAALDLPMKSFGGGRTSDYEESQKAMKAMLQMKKIDIARPQDRRVM